MIDVWSWRYSKNVYIAYYHKNNEYILCYPSLSTSVGIVRLEDWERKKYIMVSGRKNIKDQFSESWSFYNKAVTDDLYLCFFGKPYMKLTYFLTHGTHPLSLEMKVENVKTIDAIEELEGKL